MSSSANHNLDYQAANLREAIADGADAIITVDGSAETMCDGIGQAIQQNVPVVSFDVDKACNMEGQIVTSQYDEQMASFVLEQAVKDFGSGVKVGYVNDLNFTPLINRNKVYEDFKSKYDWEQVFFVENAADYDSPDDLVAAIVSAIEDLSPEDRDDLAFIYAAWDYLSTQTVAAIDTTSSSAKIYGADITDNDITVMTDPNNSPWVATAGGDASIIGASVLRMAVLSLADEIDSFTEKGGVIKIPSKLVTQEFLLENDVTDVHELLEVMPELALPDFVDTCWIETLS